MPPAVIAAGVGAAASIGGAALSAKSAKSATKTAVAEQQSARTENNALARENRDMLFQMMQPTINRGNTTGNALMELLGFGPQGVPQAAHQPQQFGQPLPAGAGQLQPNGTVAPALPAMMGGQQPYPGLPGLEHSKDMLDSSGHDLSQTGGYMSQFTAPQPTPAPQSFQAPVVHQAPQASATTPAASAMSAFDTWRNSTNYNWQQQEAAKGVNTRYAAGGLLESGAAQKALQDRSQQIANGSLGEYQNWLLALMGQGQSGMNALAGVGTNYTNQVMGNNQNAADAASNAALMRGNINGQMWSGIGGAIGSLAGQLGTSYGKKW